ncbi:uncharacterized protein METZ01_LOCUS264862 [marine metagenome]|uniref:Uncharacterized protein n=1 Tax=marine metagenome TaxID=408172 RepID=A0A382JJU7_9ZZZZ
MGGKDIKILKWGNLPCLHPHLALLEKQRQSPETVSTSLDFTRRRSSWIPMVSYPEGVGGNEETWDMETSCK